MSPSVCSAWARSRGRSPSTRRRSRCRSIYWDIQRFPELEEKYGLTLVEWDEIFAQSDVLTVQLALNDQTQGIIGAREIGLMKPTSLFINTARGKLVDQAALTDAVAERPDRRGRDRRLLRRTACPSTIRLLDLHDLPGDRVTLTPHCAWQSPWTWVRDSQEIWFNVLRSLERRALAIPGVAHTAPLSGCTCAARSVKPDNERQRHSAFESGNVGQFLFGLRPIARHRSAMRLQPST